MTMGHYQPGTRGRWSAALGEWIDEPIPAKAIEARRAATGNTDAVEDESAAPKGFAQ